jgi:AcrR family transcriptional regulator
MKSKILATSRRLFNENGFSRVSLRMIADDLNISPGNLTYHYHKKDEIVMALYHELTDQLNQSIGKAVVARDELLEKLLESTWLFFRLSWEYRFIMIEWVFFMKEYPVMRQHFEELMDLRREQFKGSFTSLRSQQMMKSEMVEGHDDELINSIFLIGNFWISQEMSQCRALETEEAVSKAVKTMIHILIPLFEPAYREELIELMNRKKPVFK